MLGTVIFVHLSWKNYHRTLQIRVAENGILLIGADGGRFWD